MFAISNSLSLGIAGPADYVSVILCEVLTLTNLHEPFEPSFSMWIFEQQHEHGLVVDDGGDGADNDNGGYHC